jgi:hypothetical protein
MCLIKRSSKFHAGKIKGTGAANFGALFHLQAGLLFASIGTFLANAYAQQHEHRSIGGTALNSLPCFHTDVRTFVHDFGYMANTFCFCYCKVRQQAFAADPCFEALLPLHVYSVHTGIRLLGLIVSFATLVQ